MCFFVSILDFVYFITELMFSIFPVLFPYLTLSTLLTLTVCRTRFTQFMKLVLSLFTLVSLCGKRSERKIRKSMNWFLVKNPNFLFLSTYSLFQSQTPSSTYCWTEAAGKHLRDAHSQRNKDLHEHFTIRKKCRGKFECLFTKCSSSKKKKP